MVSKRLDAMVKTDVDRTYLGAIDGFWVDLVLSEFAFLRSAAAPSRRCGSTSRATTSEMLIRLSQHTTASCG